MTNRFLYRNSNYFLLAFVVILSAFSSLMAAEKSNNESLALRAIMKELGTNMQLTTDAISRENWELVAKLGEKIAEHPQPPMGEKLRILTYIGNEVSKFKEYDNQTHNAAKTMVESAKMGNGQKVIESFSTLQKSCLSCHQSFRRDFLNHFYNDN